MHPSYGDSSAPVRRRYLQEQGVDNRDRGRSRKLERRYWPSRRWCQPAAAGRIVISLLSFSVTLSHAGPSFRRIQPRTVGTASSALAVDFAHDQQAALGISESTILRSWSVSWRDQFVRCWREARVVWRSSQHTELTEENNWYGWFERVALVDSARGDGVAVRRQAVARHGPRCRSVRADLQRRDEDHSSREGHRSSAPGTSGLTCDGTVPEPRQWCPDSARAVIPLP